MARAVAAFGVGWLAVVAIALVSVHGVALEYEESGPGCRSLTGSGWSELLLRALPVQITLMLWTLLAAVLLARARSRSRSLEDPEARRAAIASVWAMAVVLAAWGIGAWLGDFRQLPLFGLLVLAACVLSGLGATWVAAGHPSGEYTSGQVAGAQAGWVVLAFTLPAVLGGNGEVPQC